jgi:hypothetical protein
MGYASKHINNDKPIPIQTDKLNITFWYLGPYGLRIMEYDNPVLENKWIKPLNTFINATNPYSFGSRNRDKIIVEIRVSKNHDK